MGTGEVKWRPDFGDVAGVCRVLFDAPLEPEETRQFARAELEKLQSACSSTWNYDFVTDSPFDGRYEWTRVSHSDPEEYAVSRKDGHGSMSRHSPLQLKARDAAPPSLPSEKQPKLTEFIARKRKVSSNGKSILRPEASKLTRRASS